MQMNEPPSVVDEAVAGSTEAIRQLVRNMLGENEALAEELGRQLGAAQARIGTDNPIFQVISQAYMEEAARAQDAEERATATRRQETKGETAQGVNAQMRREATDARAQGITSTDGAPATFFPDLEATCLAWLSTNCGSGADVIVAPPATVLGAGNSAIALFNDDHRSNVLTAMLDYAEAHPEIAVDFNGLMGRVRSGSPMVIQYESAKTPDTLLYKVLIHEYGHISTGDAHETFKVFDYELRTIRDKISVAEARQWAASSPHNFGYIADQGGMWDKDGLPAITETLRGLLDTTAFQRWLQLTAAWQPAQAGQSNT